MNNLIKNSYLFSFCSQSLYLRGLTLLPEQLLTCTNPWCGLGDPKNRCRCLWTPNTDPDPNSLIYLLPDYWRHSGPCRSRISGWWGTKSVSRSLFFGQSLFAAVACLWGTLLRLRWFASTTRRSFDATLTQFWNPPSVKVQIENMSCMSCLHL